MLRGRIVFYAIVLLLRMPAVIPARNYEQQQQQQKRRGRTTKTCACVNVRVYTCVCVFTGVRAEVQTHRQTADKRASLNERLSVPSFQQD